ncbi:MAG TPA: Fe-S protein assembly co-chaperone HscB [Fredinandcohnia sp.]|nr:Fe-S protein assembly co-chaperone HscB [Fredinandcohnia sp.]
MADHFAILGIPRGFRLDETALEQRYRELSRLLHPDRHAARSPAERRLALEKMIEVNDAYRVLRDPVRRAAYLLSQRGWDLGESGNASHLPPGFLMEVMETREAFEEARAQKDRERVAKLAEAARVQREGALEALGAAFDRDDDREAAAQVAIIRYLDSFLSDVRAWEDELFEEEHG